MIIGEYSCYSIETSAFGLDGGAMFGIIPKPMWEKQAPADDRNRIRMVTRSLLLVGKSRRILIDTGNGTKWQDKFRQLYAIDTSHLNLDNSLARYGFTPDDITDVYCTHLHFDHVGGNTVYQQEKLVPAFPNATYWMQAENWKLANSPGEKDRGSFMSPDWQVLEENGLIRLVDGRESFLPGIENRVTYGHTTGQMLPVVSDGTRTLLYGADLFPMAAHIPVPWIMAYDLQPVVTAREKGALLPRMVEEDWILFFEHDPRYQAATLMFDGKHYRMRSAVTIRNGNET